MIVYNAFFATTIMEHYDKLLQHGYPWLGMSKVTLILLAIVFVLLCPSIGLASEICLGRYRLLTASLYLWLLSIVFMTLELVIPSEPLFLLHSAATYISIGCYVSCAVPFTIDQLVGASGEELSFTIYWIVWAWWVFFNLSDTVSCHLAESYQVHQAVLLSMQYLSLVSAYLMMQCCGHTLMTKPQLSNPLQLVAHVLGYAWKHKFLERRSAFTYWEDECPSRIDIGKDKYGGPFTVEQVENVKTILKLMHAPNFLY